MTTNDIDAVRQQVVDDFNATHGSVTWVRYWTGTRDDAPKYNLTDGKAWLLGGHTPVVRVRGESSCIALTHVDVLPGQPDGIADDSHDLPDPAKAAERVCEYIAANGDGIYDVIDGHPLYARDLEALRRAGEKVAELKKTRDQLAEYAADNHRAVAQLTAANRRADGLANDLRSAVKGNREYEAENLRLREQAFMDKPVIEAAQAWAEMCEDSGVAPDDCRKSEDALFDAVESHRLMDLALTSAREELPAEATR